MKKNEAIAILILLGLSCCSPSPKTTASGSESATQVTKTPVQKDARAAEVLDIREATFRYQFQKNASGQQQKAGGYFLSVRDGSKSGDPDDDFMKRFADVKPTVKRVSECTSSAGKGVVDKATGASGLIFNVDEIKWISDTEVEVSGGYYEAGLSASGNTYYLKKMSGKWVVEKDQMHWIS